MLQKLQCKCICFYCWHCNFLSIKAVFKSIYCKLLWDSFLWVKKETVLKYFDALETVFDRFVYYIKLDLLRSSHNRKRRKFSCREGKCFISSEAEQSRLPLHIELGKPKLEISLKWIDIYVTLLPFFHHASFVKKNCTSQFEVLRKWTRYNYLAQQIWNNFWILCSILLIATK